LLYFNTISGNQLCHSNFIEKNEKESKVISGNNVPLLNAGIQKVQK